MRKRRDYYVIWPAYFEASKKRREGRRVNLREVKKVAVERQEDMNWVGFLF
jgi:signal recognition particle subunit SEC65